MWAAYSLGLAAPLEVRLDQDGIMTTESWSEAFEHLPPVIMSGLAGMCAGAVGIIYTMRALQRFA